LELAGIAGRNSVEELAGIAREFNLRHVSVYDHDACARAQRSGLFDRSVQIYPGPEGLREIAALPAADLVLVAVVGIAGLEPTLHAIRAGKEIALASKEVLVLAGKFVTRAARDNKVPIIPVDSEHNALFQSLQGSPLRHVSRLMLTASGGPFREYSIEQMMAVKPEDAMRHPNWSMGPKITVDCSTMANKGLELIEAHWLFDVEPDRIEVVVHPQSIVHSIVEFVDGSMLAYLSPPSMTFAIQHALLYPDRGGVVDSPLDFARTHNLEFHPPDPDRFPCLRLAREAAETGGVAPAIFNAANEIAVEAFLKKTIGYLAISRVIEDTLSRFSHYDPESLDAVLDTDRSARRIAAEIINLEVS
jgi:1-deoxy-D-xylulose-5-phosphate reductoisomerase